MRVTVRSFAKINLGLRIGALRPDGFHELHTVYQTIALHDVIRISIARGTGVEIRCKDPRVPTDQTNTCYRTVALGMEALGAPGRVIVEIEKNLPVQGGLGGASGNAVAALLGLERALQKNLPGAGKLQLAAEVGSDLPLFLVGGTVLGRGRGEEVYPLPDFPLTYCVVATPAIAVSTPKAFADWDLMSSTGPSTSLRRSPQLRSARPGRGPGSTQTLASGPTKTPSKLTPSPPSDRITEFGRVVSAWLSGYSQQTTKSGRLLSGVPAVGGGRAETPLLDLVRTGIENDFEQVVFPQYPALRDVKRVLEASGARYASLSGSGSALYGLFRTRAQAEKSASRLRMQGVPAQLTTTLTRQQYWKKVFDC